ncbi:MAG: metal-dependent transcriptional regulator [bacterium]|nr:metal-dependent transcriptional regulator [bacterium]
MRTSWKEFGKNELTHPGAHYLMTIREVLEDQGYARLSDIAKRLNISKGSLSTSLKPLIKRKLILEDENKHLSLSSKGETFAKNIENTYSVVYHLFTNILDVSRETAEIDACKIEHLLSESTTDALLKLVKTLENDKNLLKSLKSDMNKHKSCSINGCKACKNLCL